MVQVPTARGDNIDSSELGFTLPTEAVFMYTPEVQANWPDLSFGDAAKQEERIADAARRMDVAKEYGIDTIVDRAIPGLGRNVPWVKRVAERTRMNILISTGWYTWNELPFFFNSPIESDGSRPTLADLFVRDIEVGVAGTGVKAAQIKGVTDHLGITDGVRKALGAAAEAHRRTGVPITTHTGMGIGLGTAILQAQVFQEEGVDLARVMFGHLDFTPPEVPVDDFEKIAELGSFLSFDTATLTALFPQEHQEAIREARLARVTELIKRGYGDRILLSNDINCFEDIQGSAWTDAERFPTYTEMSQDVLPRLSDRGVTDDQIEQITIHNPRTYFETRALGPY